MDKYILVTLLSTVVAPVIGFLVYKWKARVDTERSPVDTMRQALASRDAEVAQAREQLYTFMNNHLAHDKAEREQLASVLAGIQKEQAINVETLKALHQDIKQHREESSDRAGKIYEKLGIVNESLAGIKGKLGA